MKWVYEENKLSLILFTDAVNYVKSANKSIWAIFSCIAELPPLLRCSYDNILFHSMWSGPNVDFNLFLEKYNSNIDEVIKNGLFFNNKKITIKIHAFIADSPARSKATNTKQFNGKYGCIKCYHPSARNSDNTSTIYPVLKKIQIKTNENYVNDVNEAISKNKPVNGVKGFTYLSNWLTIPESILYDYMHMCLIGSFKKMIEFFFDSKNKQKDYYIGIYL